MSPYQIVNLSQIRDPQRVLVPRLYGDGEKYISYNHDDYNPEMPPSFFMIGVVNMSRLRFPHEGGQLFVIPEEGPAWEKTVENLCKALKTRRLLCSTFESAIAFSTRRAPDKGMNSKEYPPAIERKTGRGERKAFRQECYLAYKNPLRISPGYPDGYAIQMEH